MNDIILRGLAYLSGGIIWSIWFILVYFLVILILPLKWHNPTWTVIVVFMVYVWTMSNYLITARFNSLILKEKYSDSKGFLLHVFILNLALFVLSVPFYFLTQSVQDVALLYIIVTAWASNILQECFAKGWHFILTGVYGSIIWLFLIILAYVQITRVISDYTYLYFFIMPIINLTFFVTIETMDYIAWELYRKNNKNFFEISKDN